MVLKRKRDLTGSVGSISTKTIENNAVSGIGQAFAGKLAGVEVTKLVVTLVQMYHSLWRFRNIGANRVPSNVVDGMITNEGSLILILAQYKIL